MKLDFETNYSIGDRVLVNYVAQGDGQTHHHDSNMTSLFHKGDILQSEKGTIDSIIVFQGKDGGLKVTYGVMLDDYMYDHEYHVEIGAEYRIARKLEMRQVTLGVEV